MSEKRVRPIRELPLGINATGVPNALGGFSDVFKFDSPKYGMLAVKRLRFNKTGQQDLEAKVKKEATVLTMIAHPHILPFIGVSYVDGAVSIITPWAANGPLLPYLAKNSKADRLVLLSQVSSALTYLHTYAGDIIIHGDIHPGNVLISAMGTALLCDFGLSRIVPEGNSSSTWRGASGDCYGFGISVYTAPELVLRENPLPLSWATDVFAFGMLVFHAYSGKTPFGQGVHPLTIAVELHAERRPGRGEIRRADFSEDLWCLVQRCWDHLPAKRPRMPDVSRAMQSMLDRRSTSPDSHDGLKPSRGRTSTQTLSWLSRPLAGSSLKARNA